MIRPDEPHDPIARLQPHMRPQKTAVTVAQRIVHEISQNAHPPGTKLSREADMLAAYQVGRGTLREALRFLEMNGVISLKPGPGGGPIVASPDGHDLAGTLGLFMELKHTTFSSILEVREALEPTIAALAAVHQSPELIERIGESVARMAEDIDDEDQFLQENENFHELVAAASGNSVFSLLISALHVITDGSTLGVSYPRQRRTAVLAAHKRIYAAVSRQDPEEARKTMARHIAEFRTYTEKHYSGVIESRLRWSDIAP